MPTNQLPKDISNRRTFFRELRKKRGLSQLAVANISGIAQCRVSAIENQVNYRISTLQRYIRALGGELEIKVKLDGEAYELPLE